MTDLVKALRGELLDCHCYAQDRFECGCDTVWPIQVTDDAADEIERLTAALAECKAENWRTCGLVAQMHRAAMNEVIGPKRGVVEDILDLRVERDQLSKQLTETRDLAEHWATLAEQRRVELGECRKAYAAAVAFIDSHVADPDITDEMCRNYAEFQIHRDAMEAKP